VINLSYSETSYTDKGKLEEIVRALRQKNGFYGGIYIDDIDPHTPATNYIFGEIYTLSESVITLVGAPTGITTKTIPADRTIRGLFTSITLGSGAVIAYQGIDES
jgi:hypothetical protein